MAKRYWLIKSEPDVYPFAQLQKDRKSGWSGVRNYQARNFMRDEMKVGDEVFYYHSSTDVPAVVGICEVASTPYPDPTQFDPESEYYDPKSTTADPRWMMVDFKAVKALKRPVTLTELKQARGLEKMMLTQRGSRLSIQPVTAEEWQIVQKLGQHV